MNGRQLLRRALPLLALCLLMAGCSYVSGSRETLPPKFVDEHKPGTAFVFGYIDMDNARAGMDWAILNKVQAGQQARVVPMHTRDGAYYLENVAPGAYRLSEFGGRTVRFFHYGDLMVFRPYFYNLSEDDHKFRVQVDKPGIYFLGVYKFYPNADDSYELKLVNSPTQKEVLGRILENAKGSQWEGPLRDYMARLK